MTRDYEGLARVMEEIARGCGYPPNRDRYARKAEELRRMVDQDARAAAREPPTPRPRRGFLPFWRRRRPR